MSFSKSRFVAIKRFFVSFFIIIIIIILSFFFFFYCCCYAHQERVPATSARYLCVRPLQNRLPRAPGNLGAAVTGEGHVRATLRIFFFLFFSTFYDGKKVNKSIIVFYTGRWFFFFFFTGVSRSIAITTIKCNVDGTRRNAPVISAGQHCSTRAFRNLRLSFPGRYY